MRKNEVYSWRVSSDLKTAIEEAARRHGMTAAQLLELAVRHWLEERDIVADDDEEQKRIRARVLAAAGSISSGDPGRAARASELVKAKLRARHAATQMKAKVRAQRAR